jgi:hypothetical protein
MERDAALVTRGLRKRCGSQAAIWMAIHRRHA